MYTEQLTRDRLGGARRAPAGLADYGEVFFKSPLTG